jgi:hypothetical protein
VAIAELRPLFAAEKWSTRRTGELPLRKFPQGTFVPSAHFAGSETDGCEEQMEQAYRQTAQGELMEPSVPGVSWAAVLAGVVASVALTLVLLSFGAGMGFAVVSPWGNSGVSATTFKIGTGLYFIVMAMISSAIGGYLGGRLRTKWVGVQTTEVHFRDAAHGWPGRRHPFSVPCCWPLRQVRLWAEHLPAPPRQRPTPRSHRR